MSAQGFGPSYFAVITGPVLDDRELSANAKLLFASITTMTDKAGYCWAGNAYLADRFGWGERTVSRLIAQLTERGFITYRMVKNEENGKMERRIFIGIDGAEGVAKIGEGTRQNWRGGVAKNGETINMMNNKREESTPLPPKEVFDRIAQYAAGDQELADAILKLCANRLAVCGAKKAVKTLQCINGILNKLTTLSGGSRQAKLQLLEKAIVNNWLTVYPLKPDELAPSRPAQAGDGEEGFDGI